MFITTHPAASFVELVVKPSDWYLKIRLNLEDNRHNNEFLVINRYSAEGYLKNIKELWNVAATYLRQILDSMDINFTKDEFKDELDNFENLWLECENSLCVAFMPSDISYDDYLIYKEIDPIEDYNYWHMYFKRVIKIRQIHKNGSLELDSLSAIHNYIKALSELKLLAENIFPLIKEINEKRNSLITIQEDVSSNMKELLLKQYEGCDENIIYFNKLKMIDEHGSSEY